MTPPLPPELLSEVLGHAVAAWLEPGERQSTRNAFRRVCRGWRDSFDYWRELEVEGCSQLARLTALLGETPAGPGLKLLSTRSLGVVLSWDVDVGTAVEVRARLVELIERVPRLREMKLVVKSALAEADDERELCSGLVSVLCGLGQLRHFTLATEEEWSSYVSCSTDQLNQPVHWPRLNHLRLDRVHLVPGPSSSDHLPALASLAHLHSVHIDNFEHVKALQVVLSSLPTTISTLTVNDYELYTSLAFAKAVSAHLQRRGASLRELALLDEIGACAGGYTEAVDRGVYDLALPQLVNLRVLAISPCAVENLSASLVPLAHLAELTVQQGYGEIRAELTADEVAEYVGVAPGLRELTVSYGVSKRWPSGSKPQVERAAKGRGVKVRWCDVAV